MIERAWPSSRFCVFGEIRFLSIKKDSKGYLDIQWCIAVGTKCHVGMKTDIYVLKNLI